MTAPVPLVRYGLVAGAVGAGMLWPSGADDVADDARSAPVSVDVAVAALRRGGARFVLAELPGDPQHARLAGALRAIAFGETGRIPDLVDDGVDLHFFRLELHP